VSPAFSPDGKRLAYSASRPGGNDVWLKDLDREVLARLTLLSGYATAGTWTHDGKAILFRLDENAGPALYRAPADGSGEPKRLDGDWSRLVVWTVSPDDKSIIVQRSDATGIASLHLAPFEGAAAGKFEEYAAGPGAHSHPKFSPDGHWVAYCSDESGASEIYVKPFPGPGARRQVTSSGGDYPIWSQAGHELLYQAADRRVMRIEYTAAAGSITFGRPRPWGNVRPSDIGGYAWDLSPDGKRIAAVILAGGVEEKPITELSLLMNFFPRKP
jgi:Tol biopolymer transport system component